MSLTLAKGATEVTGTVEGADTTLSYAEVASGRFGANVSAENRSRATANLRKALADADRYHSFARHLNGEEKLLTLKNDVLSLDISTHGGSIARATLLDYYNYLPKPGTTDDIDTTRVDVWQLNQAGYNFVLTSASQRFDTGSFFFTPKEQTDSTLLMTLDLGNGASWVCATRSQGFVCGTHGDGAERHGGRDTFGSSHRGDAVAPAYGPQRARTHLRGAQLGHPL